MATIAQVAAQRRRQVSAIRAVMRTADSAGEKLERKLKTYSNKRKMIEAKDMSALNTLYKDYINKSTQVERELTNLNTLVSS